MFTCKQGASPFFPAAWVVICSLCFAASDKVSAGSNIVYLEGRALCARPPCTLSELTQYSDVSERARCAFCGSEYDAVEQNFSCEQGATFCVR